MIISILLIFIFLAGIYYYAYYNHPDQINEGFENTSETRCPNILIQKGSQLFLYNNRIAKIPGVNPIQFANLEDYIEFTDWQRSQGIRCPILFLQHSYDAQGNSVYKVRPGPTNLQGGLPPFANPTVMNGGSPSTTLVSQDINEPTTATATTTATTTEKEDNLLHTNVSPNAMDDNWGGVNFTQTLVDKGYYAGDEVDIYVP
jgi:hypothetical protein